MRALCNSAIEPGTNLFEIALVQFGTVNRPATRRVVKVLASTANGAKRIVRSRYPRSSSYEVIAKCEGVRILSPTAIRPNEPEPQ